MKKILVPGIIAGLAIFLVNMIVTIALGMAFPSLNLEYLNTNVFRAMSDPLMSLFYVYMLVLGIMLAWVWDKTKELNKAKSAFQRAFNFGAAYFAIATITGMLATYSSFQVSLLMVLSWTLIGLLNGILAGLVFAKMNK